MSKLKKILEEREQALMNERQELREKYLGDTDWSQETIVHMIRLKNERLEEVRLIQTLL